LPPGSHLANSSLPNIYDEQLLTFPGQEEPGSCLLAASWPLPLFLISMMNGFSPVLARRSLAPASWQQPGHLLAYYDEQLLTSPGQEEPGFSLLAATWPPPGLLIYMMNSSSPLLARRSLALASWQQPGHLLAYYDEQLITSPGQEEPGFSLLAATWPLPLPWTREERSILGTSTPT
jgi:hypothetical protein